MDLTIETTVDGGVLFHVRGRLDAYTVSTLKAAWMNPQSWTLYVNLADTTFIDSMGLAALVQGLKLSRENDGELIIVKPSAAARTILQMTSMLSVFTIREDVPAVGR